MYTVAIRVFRNGYLIAKHYCKSIDADQWIRDWRANNELISHRDEYRYQISEIGRF